MMTNPETMQRMARMQAMMGGQGMGGMIGGGGGAQAGAGAQWPPPGTFGQPAAGEDLEIGEEGRGSVSGERKGIGPPCQVFK